MQSAKGSMWETLSGTAIGFVVSVTVWQFVVKPVWGLETSFVENLNITLLFTLVSVIRGYVVRRFFNMMHNKKYKKAAHDTTTGNFRAGSRG